MAETLLGFLAGVGVTWAGWWLAAAVRKAPGHAPAAPAGAVLYRVGAIVQENEGGNK